MGETKRKYRKNSGKHKLERLLKNRLMAGRTKPINKEEFHFYLQFIT